MNEQAYTYGEEMELFMRSWARRCGNPSESSCHHSMLLLDDYAWHKQAEVVRKLRAWHATEIHHIDGGLTPVLQPLDVGVNSFFKAKIQCVPHFLIVLLDACILYYTWHDA